MTTLAQVKNVTRPLLERNPDLALIGRMVVITPVRHVVRGMVFEGSREPVVFHPIWFVNFLFKPDSYMDPAWSDRFFPKESAPFSADRRDPRAAAEKDLQEVATRNAIILEQMRLPMHERRFPEEWPYWTAHDPTTASRMCEVIEEQVLPILRPVQSIDDLVTFASEPDRFWGANFEGHYFNQPFVYAAQGNPEAAVAPCRRLAAEYPNSPMVKEFLRMLTERDRAGLAKWLHGWEAAAVKRMKLESVWEPSPFPLEMTS